jgi:hypothetical protein
VGLLCQTDRFFIRHSQALEPGVVETLETALLPPLLQLAQPLVVEVEVELLLPLLETVEMVGLKERFQ